MQATYHHVNMVRLSTFISAVVYICPAPASKELTVFYQSSQRRYQLFQSHKKVENTKDEKTQNSFCCLLPLKERKKEERGEGETEEETGKAQTGQTRHIGMTNHPTSLALDLYSLALDLYSVQPTLWP
jgi:hypothetical protein